MKLKYPLFILFVLITIPFVMASSAQDVHTMPVLSENMFSNCNFTPEEEALATNLLLKDELSNLDQKEVISLMSKCDQDSIDPSLIESEIGNFDMDNINLSELENNPELLEMVETYLVNYSCIIINETKSKIEGVEIPQLAPLKDDVLNVYLGDEGLASIKMNHKKVERVSCVIDPNPTYVLMVKDLLVIKSFAESTNLPKTYLELRKSGDIKLEGKGFGNSMKVGFLNFGIKVASWFSDMEKPVSQKESAMQEPVKHLK